MSIQQEIAGGDRGWTDEEIRFLSGVARRMAGRWCSCSADAEDVAQEAMLRLFMHRSLVRRRLQWLYVVIRRLSRDVRGRIESSPLEDPFPDGSLACDANLSELKLDAQSILARQTERNRMLLILAFHGYTHAEIAGAMGCSIKNVGTLLARARTTVRREFSHLPRTRLPNRTSPRKTLSESTQVTAPIK